MKRVKSFWFVGAAGIALVIAAPMIFFWPRAAQAKTPDAWGHVPKHTTHTSHADIVKGALSTGPDATAACLTCHPDAVTQFAHTTHWTWQSRPFSVAGRPAPVTIGKANQLNNFCISAQGNQKKCTSCHAGYNWQEGKKYDFANTANVDCLVCHADPNLYSKGDYGNPANGVDLLAAARSVRAPTRENCGACHFNGGGGDNVKHGDLDQGLNFPPADLDVHMGANNFLCTDCHTTRKHAIKGRLVADNYQIAPTEQVACTDCHSAGPHGDARLNAHTQSVACQACHVPAVALDEPTKVSWDWSTAGRNLPEDHYTYLKIKGSFVYEKNVQPAYLWYNGNLSYRYLLGDKIDPTSPTVLDRPAGSIDDPAAKIYPFKVHRGRQPYDANYNYLLAPITAGDGGFWTTFNWDQAFKLAEQPTGLDYSGQYGFAETLMYWPSTHMVQPGARALQCLDCHSANGRLDWPALGYPGDPMIWGGRNQSR